jgi:hypothetical protein
MQGYDRFRLAELYAERDNEKVGDSKRSSNSTVSKSKLSKGKFAQEEELVNWFDVDNEVTKRNHVQNTKCTYTDKYGNTVSLDDSYIELRRS